MHWVTRTLATAAGLIACQLVACSGADASGVGAAFYHYQPAKPVQPTSYCGSAECGDTCSSCSECRRLGFACVDHATPAPCAAEGCCTPRVATFGHYQNQWRRWPGDVEESGPAPEEAVADDTYLGPIDPPSPTEEDQQAPPPIEDEAPEAEPTDEGVNQLEITLPPLPDARPEPVLPRPEAPNRGNGPPPLPFGAVSPRLPEFVPPSNHPEVTPTKPMPRPTRVARPDGDNPPPLPSGFTSTRRRVSPTRLPTVDSVASDRYRPIVQVSHTTR